MKHTFIGHDKGLLRQGADDASRKEVLQDEDVVALAHDPANRQIILAGTYGHGLFRSTDGGTGWSRVALDVDFVRTLVFSECEPGCVFLGMEPAELFRSRDSGATWECLHIRRLPEAASWSLPYSPRSGALRTIAPHPNDPLVIDAGVEQGGIIRSTDGGKSWTIDHEKVDEDVHWLARHPSDPGTLLLATGGGLFITHDDAESWLQLFPDYTRATLFHPAHPSIAFAGPAHTVGEHGRIIRSHARGDTWELASEGIHLPMADMVEYFTIDPFEPGELLAITSEGQVFHSQAEQVRWKPVSFGVAVQCLDFVEAS
jgi:photosystem II stability/assembly factor-like uncharacterized protein